MRPSRILCPNRTPEDHNLIKLETTLPVDAFKQVTYFCELVVVVVCVYIYIFYPNPIPRIIINPTLNRHYLRMLSHKLFWSIDFRKDFFRYIPMLKFNPLLLWTNPTTWDYYFEHSWIYTTWGCFNTGDIFSCKILRNSFEVYLYTCISK